MMYKMENYYGLAIWQNYIDNICNKKVSWNKIIDSINICKYHKLQVPKITHTHTHTHIHTHTHTHTNVGLSPATM